MKISKINLRQLFEKGKKPAQEAFYNLFDSYWHKDEEVPIDAVSGLQTQLSNKLDVSAQDTLISAFHTALNEASFGLKGKAIPATVPTAYNSTAHPNGLYEKYDVEVAGTFINFLKADGQPLVITADDLKGLVQITVSNGVAEKFLKALPQALPDGVIAENNTKAISGGEAFNKTVLNSDILLDVDLINYAPYIVDGYTYNGSGQEIVGAGNKIVRDLPINALKGNIVLSNFPADQLRKLFIKDSAGAIIGGISSLTTAPFTRALVANAATVCFTLKRNTESVTPDLRLEYGTVPNTNAPIKSIKGKVISATKLADNNIVPTPINDANAVNKKYLTDNAVLVSQITKETIFSVNKLNRAFLQTGKYINPAGEVGASPSQDIIQGHPIGTYQEQKITFKGFTPASIKKLVFRDNLGVITGSVLSLTTSPYTITVPLGAITFDMSVKSSGDTVSSYDELMMNEGNQPLPYVPYVQELIKKINGFPIYAEKSKEASSGGGTAYDQSLNKADDVHFNSVTVNQLIYTSVQLNLPRGAGSPPPECALGDTWVDTLAGGTHKTRLD